MEASHSNFSYDPTHKLVVDPPRTGSSTQTVYQSADDMQNSSATESPKMPVETAKSEK